MYHIHLSLKSDVQKKCTQQSMVVLGNFLASINFEYSVDALINNREENCALWENHEAGECKISAQSVLNEFISDE